MKRDAFKFVFLFSCLFVCTGVIRAQDSIVTDSKELVGVENVLEDTTTKDSSVDTIENLLRKDSNKIEQSNSDQSLAKGPSGGSTTLSRDTLIVQTQKRPESSGADKIADLSKFLSGDNIFYSLLFVLIGYVIIKALTFVFNALAERSTKYRITFKGLIPIVKIAGWILIITLIIVVVFKPSVATMLAFSASIGVAVGFASQDILKNIFGGIVILLDRPFVSGDKIEVDKYYGEVVEIGLRSTRIVTPDDSLVSVPNAVMMSSSLSNANAGEPNCQVVAEIFLPLTIDTIKTRELATQAATVSKYIYLNKPITVLFLNEANTTNSYYKMKVKAYVMDIRDEFRFKSDMTELIITELVKEKVLTGQF